MGMPTHELYALLFNALYNGPECYQQIAILALGHSNPRFYDTLAKELKHPVADFTKDKMQRPAKSKLKFEEVFIFHI